MKIQIGRTLLFTSILTLAFMVGLVMDRTTLAATPVCEKAECREMEEEVLAATVRIQLEVWAIKEDESGFDIEGDTSHATLVEPSYLVTHNHFDLLEQADSTESSIRVVLFDSNGQIMLKAPLTDFIVHELGDQTLVFEMRHSYMADRLVAAGARFAEISDWRQLRIAPGDVVAQVVWDGESTGIQWTEVEEVVYEEGVPRLVLADGIDPGSSGGGVFRDGVHLANNWKYIRYKDMFGNYVSATSVAALNLALPGVVADNR